MPPANEKRPSTGTRPGWNTIAFENRAPFPLLTKNPETPRPLAWLRRNPAWTPFTYSNPPMNRAGVRARGVNHPPRYANPPATTTRIRPTFAIRSVLLGLLIRAGHR